jgi:hypothetical protein
LRKARYLEARSGHIPEIVEVKGQFVPCLSG